MCKNDKSQCFFSIIIPSYNSSRYIRRAIDSISSQDFDDYEIIVVDDASTDETPALLKALASKNDKLKLCLKEENNGTLSARAYGVDLASGNYTLLLDQDDELENSALKRLNGELKAKSVDILHFGCEVVPENETARRAKDDTEAWMNPHPQRLEGKDILSNQFNETSGFDWNVHHKAFDTQLAKRAWSVFRDENLCYADDMVVSFILSAYASSYRSLDDSKLYLYHLGAGETLSEDYDLNSFIRVNSLDAKAMSLIRKFVSEARYDLARDDLEDIAGECESRLVSHVMNEINDHLDKSLLGECLNEAEKFWSPTLIALELWRFVRDRAYDDFIKKSGDLKSDKYLRILLKHALRINDKAINLNDDRLVAMRDMAIRHLRETKSLPNDYFYSTKIEDGIAEVVNTKSCGELPAIAKSKTPGNARIFVSCHKEVDVFDSEILTPVQVGASRAQKRFPWCYGDDDGENISESNPMYCELTAQYWAWKNVDCDWYGFCHYRRYFNFSTETYSENDFGEVIDGYIDAETQARYSLRDEDILNVLDGCDLVTTKFQDIASFPGDFSTPKEHWHSAPYLYDTDLKLMVEVALELYPDYADALKTYMDNSVSCFGNMFIMKKDMFHEYSEWLFSILEEFGKRYDPKNYSKEALRTIGHLGERLLNVFVIKKKQDDQSLRHRELQCVHFDRPDKTIIPACTFKDESGDRSVVPVVLAADDAYVPILTTAIYSILENASPEFNYDIIVFHSNIAPGYQYIMREFVGMYDNASLRFIMVDHIVGKCRLTTSNEHISVETYYRFLIQALLPQYDKVIYLDSDLVVEGDISELYKVELGDNLIAAVKDIDFLGNLNYKDGHRATYNDSILLMDNPYNYFQAGVLVLNTRELRKLHKVDSWLLYASDESFIYNDQDILNSECEHRVTFLPSEWNVMHDCGYRIGNVFSFAPCDVFDEFQEARKNPKVVHYAGYQKPWKYENVDMEEYFWKYARETPFVQKIIERRIIWVEKWQIQDALDARFERHQSVYHPLISLPAKTARKMKGNKK